MRIIRYKSDKGSRLGLWAGEKVNDLTKLNPVVCKSFIALANNAYSKSTNITNLVTEILEDNTDNIESFQYKEFERSDGKQRLLIPIKPPEVWGCGVTYKRSRAAREFETGLKGVYDLVYDAERPEIFFKGTAGRCIGPNESIGVRGDSKWSVPEPELAFILGPDKNIIGFTCGNDVTARDIEGENPLYLPQAKTYDSCCALGPALVTTDEVGVEPRLDVECEIYRSGEKVFSGSINTSEMRRSIEELKTYLCKYNPVPVGTVCLTGTGVVPPDDFSLEEGDVVEIKIEKIGTLRNNVKVLKD